METYPSLSKPYGTRVVEETFLVSPSSCVVALELSSYRLGCGITPELVEYFSTIAVPTEDFAVTLIGETSLDIPITRMPPYVHGHGYRPLTVPEAVLLIATPAFTEGQLRKFLALGTPTKLAQNDGVFYPFFLADHRTDICRKNFGLWSERAIYADLVLPAIKC